MLEQSNLNIVFVHGMGSYSSNDPGQVIAHLVSSLGLTSKGNKEIQQVMFEGKQVGWIKESLYEHNTGHSVRFKEVDWEISTYGSKLQAFEIDNDKNDTRHARLPKHSEIKRLQNFSLGDVALYLNPSVRPGIQEATRVALQDIGASLDEGDDQSTRSVVIGYSLGSRIVFDIMDEASSDDNQKKINEFTASVDRFFMLANQLSLLGLAIDGSMTKQETKSYFSYFDTKQNNEKNGKQFKIIAITDPNDHLSYRIEKTMFDSAIGDQILDIDCSVAKRAYLVPSIGWMVNPATAHTRYGNTERVLDLITNGYTLTE